MSKQSEKAEQSEAMGDAAKVKAAEANEAKTESAKADLEAEAAREDNVIVNKPHAPEAVAEQHRKVAEFNEKRNEENLEGHQRNMQRIEDEANEAQARTQHADDPRARHVPTGKQQNRNTPRVLKDGTKVWDQ